jgi:hypothetical protein
MIIISANLLLTANKRLFPEFSSHNYAKKLLLQDFETELQI